MSFIWYIIIGIIAGFLAGKIMRGGGFGLIINLLLGIQRVVVMLADMVDLKSATIIQYTIKGRFMSR